MILDDCECMRGPAWSVTLLGVDVGFACKHVDDSLDLSMTIYRCCYHLSRNQYDVIINLVWVIFYVEERVSTWRNRKKKSVRRQSTS